MLYDQTKVIKNTFYEINNIFIERYRRSDILKVGELSSVQKYNDIKYSHIFTSFLEPGFNKFKEEGKFQSITLGNKEKLKNITENFIEVYQNIIHELTQNKN